MAQKTKEQYSAPAPLPDDGWKTSRHIKTRRAKSLRQNQTDAETVFWHAVKAKRFHGYKFRRQYPVGPYYADFACLERKTIIEIDGGQHSENMKDEVRTALLEKEGFKVIRFWNNDLLQNIDGVLETLLTHLQGPHGPQ